MSLYARKAGKRLQAILDELSSTEKNRLSLLEEIDLSRATAVRAVETLAAIEAAEDGGKEIPHDLKMAAHAALRGALSHVADMVRAAVAVEKEQREGFGPQDVGSVLHQVVKIMEEMLPAGLKEDVLKRLESVRVTTPRVVLEIK